jgi:hypothetical protein
VAEGARHLAGELVALDLFCVIVEVQTLIATAKVDI